VTCCHSLLVPYHCRSSMSSEFSVDIPSGDTSSDSTDRSDRNDRSILLSEYPAAMIAIAHSSLSENRPTRLQAVRLLDTFLAKLLLLLKTSIDRTPWRSSILGFFETHFDAIAELLWHFWEDKFDPVIDHVKPSLYSTCIQLLHFR
jgi:hypothetical protein